MEKLIEVKASELSGAALDWAVAQVDGVKTMMMAPRNGEPKQPFALFGSLALSVGGDDQSSYAPSTCWHCGGPLIEKYAIGFVGHDADNWLAFFAPEDKAHEGIGATHLIAACRAIVAAKLGDEVDVPEGLV